MGVTAKGIPRGCQGLFTPVSLGYPLSVFNINFTLNTNNQQRSGASGLPYFCTPPVTVPDCDVIDCF